MSYPPLKEKVGYMYKDMLLMVEEVRGSSVIVSWPLDPQPEFSPGAGKGYNSVYIWNGHETHAPYDMATTLHNEALRDCPLGQVGDRIEELDKTIEKIETRREGVVWEWIATLK